jgi:hypothetical protein
MIRTVRIIISRDGMPPPGWPTAKCSGRTPTWRRTPSSASPRYLDGVSTVDIELARLHAFLAQPAVAYGGYAFAIDHVGKFLSFPLAGLSSSTEGEANSEPVQPVTDLDALARTQPGFAAELS